MNPKITIIYIFLFVFFNINLTTSQQQQCMTPSPDQQSGECILLRNCGFFYNFLLRVQRAGVEAMTSDQRQHITRSWCGSEGRNHKVCCPLNDTGTIENTSTNYNWHPNLNLLENSRCGGITDDKLRGGNSTDPMEFPWMVIIQQRTASGILQICGGTLISKRYVLTAAHCIRRDNIVSVVLGEHNKNTDPDCTAANDCADLIQVIDVESTVSHPRFVFSAFNNDIGLIRLARDVVFSESIKPICLPVTVQNQNVVLRNVKVTGWGITESKAESTVLLQADLPVITNTQCATTFRSRRINVTPTHICAGSREADSCSGDSGGPLIHPAVTQFGQKYLQYGVVSAGSNCNFIQDLPGLYTRVVPYMKWILNNLRD